MSVRVSSWVWQHSSVEHRGDLLVLLVLADHAQDDGTGADPSVATIARKARLSRRGAFLALERLKAERAIEPDQRRGPRGTVSYRVLMPDGVQPVHGAATAPVQSATPGGAVTAPEGVHSPAPEPSLTIQNRNSPRASAGAHEAAQAERTVSPSPIDDERQRLAEQIRGLLQRGIDGLTPDDAAKRPTRDAILTTLAEHDPAPQVAMRVAIEVRSIAQAQNRAPNITALYAQKLQQATQNRQAP
jgi:hypothetical protein